MSGKLNWSKSNKQLAVRRQGSEILNDVKANLTTPKNRTTSKFVDDWEVRKERHIDAIVKRSAEEFARLSEEEREQLRKAMQQEKIKSAAPILRNKLTKHRKSKTTAKNKTGVENKNIDLLAEDRPGRKQRFKKKFRRKPEDTPVITAAMLDEITRDQSAKRTRKFKIEKKTKS